jgi:UDP:flavonoid glycosyltransferase YjiC (YdhE family)
VHDLGVAAAPVPYRKFTAERLDEALKVVLTDDALRRRAAEVSELVRAEDGLGDAVTLLEEWVARTPGRTGSRS